MQRKSPIPAMTMPPPSASLFATAASGGNSRGQNSSPTAVRAAPVSVRACRRPLPQPAVRVAAQPDREQKHGRRNPYQHEQQLRRVVEGERKGQAGYHAPDGQGDFPQLPLLVEKKPFRCFLTDRAAGAFGGGGCFGGRGPGGLRGSGGGVGRILVEQIVHRHME